MTHHLEIERILVPTDGSEGALAGARRGIDLARAANAEIHVLSVVDTEASSLFQSQIDDEAAEPEATAEASVEAVANAADRADASLDVTTAVERGPPHETIADYASANDVDVVAMGTKGRTGLERVLLGSVTERVLRTVEIPVLAVPPESGYPTPDGQPYETVLLPTDGSEGATVAVDWSLSLAALFDAMVHTLFSVDTSRVPATPTPSDVLTDLERTGEAALEEVRTRADDAGVSVTGLVASGPPTRVILQYVDDNEIDLIVMGTHGRSELPQHVLGSVTENVVRNADVPVFCVPMADDA
ncbi:universal stress protein [Natrinema salaciae]|uniref:Nucleotide-binding universal stress protein, UspA family n=1 Tax=Natrinema salaciae TaxID=1186196 RepID=A0A1H9SPI8_9EURY|nr:universal stress protein [Natrinema salaciae]SER86323.1 Nucleotide-binding universal stress protein, UspA family [Natrinema salaciae]